MKNFIGEFREFAMRGNVIDLAVGVVIGTAFGNITNSLVKDVITPPLGVLMGKVNFSNLKWTMIEAQGETAAVTINYGLFIQTIFNFVIVAWAMFLLVKLINTLRRKQDEHAADAPPPPRQEVLLEEIRDILKNRQYFT